jgi:hypothetical protein
LETLVVAYRREGPTSSDLELDDRALLALLGVVGAARRRPLTITLVPRVSDSATFSARLTPHRAPMKRVSPSFHSFEFLSNVRGVEATVKFATAAPDGVNRSSGSFVRLPMMVMTVSPAMAVCLLQWAT